MVHTLKWVYTYLECCRESNSVQCRYRGRSSSDAKAICTAFTDCPVNAVSPTLLCSYIIVEVEVIVCIFSVCFCVNYGIHHSIAIQFLLHIFLISVLIVINSSNKLFNSSIIFFYIYISINIFVNHVNTFGIWIINRYILYCDIILNSNYIDSELMKHTVHRHVITCMQLLHRIRDLIHMETIYVVKL